jgi:putative phosphoesterase
MIEFGDEEAEAFSVPIRIGIVADTHLRNPARLPPQLVEPLQQVDLILHAGDVTSLATLRLFEEIAPVRAVVGNNDDAVLQQTLPFFRRFQFGPFTAGLMHGHGFQRHTARKAAEKVLRGQVDMAIFGHSHRPVCEWQDGFLLFNPGSATNNRWEPLHSYGVIQIRDTIEAELRFLL